MAIINATAGDTIAWADLDAGSASKDTSDTIVFSELLCVNSSFNAQTGDNLLFIDYAIGSAPSNTAPGGGIGTGPVTFFGVFNRNIADDLSFMESIAVMGGMTLDETCVPPTYVVNEMSWTMLADWTGMSTFDWHNLSE